jgi:voltage-gated potassium channel
MDAPVTALGVVFLLLVLIDTVARPHGTVARVIDVGSWVLWAVFVAEFVLRAIVAPSAWRFVERHWWQLAFLAVPFLRFTRILARLRIARLGRVVSSAVRSSRSAMKTLSSRLAWLGVLTVIVALAASLLLHELALFDSYGDALHAAALATITGESTGAAHGVAQILDVVLAAYSVGIFATLAGALGAYFLEEQASRWRAPSGDAADATDMRSRAAAPDRAAHTEGSRRPGGP